MSDLALQNQQQQQQQIQPITRAPLKLTRGGVELETFDDAWRLAHAIAKTPFKPKGFESPESVLMAMMFARNIGLDPITGIQNIAVINGRPTVWGDALKAIVSSSQECEWIHEEFEGEYPSDDFKAVCTTQRKGKPKQARYEFSIADAKTAGLWGKQGPWQQYPKRMLQMRARGFCVRDEYPDVTKGIYATEEMEGVEITGQAMSASVAADRIAASTSRVSAAIDAVQGAAEPGENQAQAVKPAAYIKPAKSPIEMAGENELTTRTLVVSAVNATSPAAGDFLTVEPATTQNADVVDQPESAPQAEPQRRPGRPRKVAQEPDALEQDAIRFSDGIASVSMGLAWINDREREYPQIVSSAKVSVGVMDASKATLEQMQRLCYLVKLGILRWFNSKDMT